MSDMDDYQRQNEENRRLQEEYYRQERERQEEYNRLQQERQEQDRQERARQEFESQQKFNQDWQERHERSVASERAAFEASARLGQAQKAGEEGQYFSPRTGGEAISYDYGRRIRESFTQQVASSHSSTDGSRDYSAPQEPKLSAGTWPHIEQNLASQSSPHASIDGARKYSASQKPQLVTENWWQIKRNQVILGSCLLVVAFLAAGYHWTSDFYRQQDIKEKARARAILKSIWASGRDSGLMAAGSRPDGDGRGAADMHPLFLLGALSSTLKDSQICEFDRVLVDGGQSGEHANCVWADFSIYVSSNMIPEAADGIFPVGTIDPRYRRAPKNSFTPAGIPLGFGSDHYVGRHLEISYERRLLPGAGKPGPTELSMISRLMEVFTTAKLPALNSKDIPAWVGGNDRLGVRSCRVAYHAWDGTIIKFDLNCFATG